MQGSQSRLRDENVSLTGLTAQVKNKKHVSDCNQIAAEQVPALSSAEWAQGSPGSAREANEEVSVIRESPASPGASRFNTERREQWVSNGRRCERLTEAVEAVLKDAQRMQMDTHCLDRISKGEVMASTHLGTFLTCSQDGAGCILGDAQPAQMKDLGTPSLNLVNAIQKHASKS